MSPVRWRPATRTERELAALWAAAALSSVVLQPVWIAIAPHLPSCTFRSLTGIPCPSCGTTRAAVALLRLDFGSALAANPLATLAGLAFVVGGAAAAIWLVLRGPWPVTRMCWSRGWTAVVIGAVVINWVYLVLAG